MLFRSVWKFPHIANADGAPGAQQNKAQAAAQLFALFHNFHFRQMSAALSLICRTILHDYASVCKRVSSTARRTVPGRRVHFSARRSSSLVLAILNKR